MTIFERVNALISFGSQEKKRWAWETEVQQAAFPDTENAPF